MKIAALLASIAVVFTAAPSNSPRPALRLVPGKGRALIVAGAGFHANERVVVSVLAGGFHVREVDARHGRFRVSFPRVRRARCGPLRVTAVGDKGSRAVLVHPMPICPRPAPSPSA